MNEITSFSPEQQVVLDRIAGGKSIGAAAHAAGIHRNTVANWRHASEDFHKAYDQAHYDQVMACRDRAVDMAPEAMYTIMSLMKDPSTPPGIRLRAALEIQKRAETLPPPDPAAKLAQHAQAAQTESETAAILVLVKQMVAEVAQFIAGRAPADDMLASLLNLAAQLEPRPAQPKKPAHSAQPAQTTAAEPITEPLKSAPQTRNLEPLPEEVITAASPVAEHPTAEMPEIFTHAGAKLEGN